jgi:hypothetical protein
MDQTASVKAPMSRCSRVAAIGWLALVASAAAGQPGSLPALSLHELEQGFWYCDRLASTRLVGAAETACCSLVTEAFKQRKFDGDFARLLDWWRERKSSQPSATAVAYCPGQNDERAQPQRRSGAERW